MSASPDPYDASYFAQFRDSGRSSADVIAAILADRYAPAGVVDVGCGEGYFLDAFAALGVADTVGVDGPFNTGEIVRAHGHEYAAVDLERQDLALGRRFDLALCLEVAEHLEGRHAARLVATLVESAPVVAFSAAIPDQHGRGHVHLRPQSYWVGLFARHGYRPSDPVRPRVWNDARVSWWYAQNLLVFAPDGGEPIPLLDVVHPGMLTRALEVAHENPPRPSGREALGIATAALRARVGRLRPGRSGPPRPTLP